MSLDWVSIDLVKQFTAVAGTVVVAVLAAVFATRRDTRQARMQRHFAFSDNRSSQYAEFVCKVNDTWAIWFEYANSWDEDAFLVNNLKARNTAARELDNQMNVLSLTAPKRVVRACAQVNGALQTMMFENQPADSSAIYWQDYEDWKARMIAAMREDIELIESSSNRLSYTKAVRKKT